MKKVISLLLAILMAFSAVTVAFATDAGAADPDVDVSAPVEGEEGEEGESEEAPVDLGEFQWILDLPFWTVGPALKFAKIALKLVNVYLKVAKIFGIVDKDMGDMIMEAILDMIENSQNAENGEAEEPSTEAPAPDADIPAVA